MTAGRPRGVGRLFQGTIGVTWRPNAFSAVLAGNFWVMRGAQPLTATESGARFAHPVEDALARVFDRFGIEWRYEPRTFVLERRQGRIVEACTPDFYLPELDMYVECTCMKQRLATKKNRKYRKLRERFGVVVEIMYLRDFIRLGRRHGLSELVQAAHSGVNGDAR
jgi:hypothetical protein